MKGKNYGRFWGDCLDGVSAWEIVNKEKHACLGRAFIWPDYIIYKIRRSKCRLCNYEIKI